jgi:hypothetical protein
MSAVLWLLSYTIMFWNCIVIKFIAWMAFAPRRGVYLSSTTINVTLQRWCVFRFCSRNMHVPYDLIVDWLYIVNVWSQFSIIMTVETHDVNIIQSKLFAHMLLKDDKKEVKFQLDSGATANLIPKSYLSESTEIENCDHTLLYRWHRFINF